MSIDITIGTLKNKTTVLHQEHPEAPAIEGHWMKPRINTWGGGITHFHEAVRRCGFFDLVDCDCYGDWEWGLYLLDDDELKEIIIRCDEVFHKHPGVQPKCKVSEEEHDVALATWLKWWAQWGLKQDMPIYLQVTY